MAKVGVFGEHGKTGRAPERQKAARTTVRRGLLVCDAAQGQIGSPMTEVAPPLKSPVATVGGAEPEQTGLPYLSRRCER